MLIYICLLIMIFICTIISTDVKNRSMINPAIIYSFIWIIFTALAAMRLNSMYPTSDEAGLVIVLGVLFFCIGVFIASLFKSTYTVSGKLNQKYRYELRYSLFIVLTLGCILYYLPGFLKSVLAMLQGLSLNDVRSDIQAGEYSKGLANLIPNYVILPLSVTVEVLAIVDFWCGKRNYVFIGSVLFLVLIRTLGDGGRTPLFNIVLYFIVAYFVSTDKSKRSENRKERLAGIKNKKLFTICGSVGVLGLVVLSLMRAAATIFRKLYWYFGMAPVMLSSWMEYVDNAAYRAYGLVSFNGPIYFIDYIRKNATGGNYLGPIIDAYNWIAETDSYWVKIAPSTTANAYVSSFWFFYADGGIFGVIILSLLYGLVCGLLYYNMCRNKSIKNIAVYLFFFQGIFFSFIRFPYAKAYYFIALFVLCVFAFKREKIKG